VIFFNSLNNSLFIKNNLSAHEKQMSASQPLVFHLRVLYNAYTQKAKAAE
jgi:hypothetical protein